MTIATVLDRPTQDPSREAPMKTNTKLGTRIFDCWAPTTKLAITMRGISQSVLPILTVVAISAASVPYICAVATTELVSCMAKAAQTPNCSWLRFNQVPMVGKVINAMALSKSTTHNAAPVCSGRAAMMGDKVAIVVPPQMAVPGNQHIG